MNTLSKIILVNALFLGAISFTGCYTVLVHHNRETHQQQTGDENQAETELCDLCGGDHTTIYHYSGLMQDPDFGQYSRWNYYYNNPMPWWAAGEPDSTDESVDDNGSESYSSRNYGRRRQALEEKTGSINGGAVESGSGGYSGAATGGVQSTGTGAVISTPAVQSDSTGGQTGGGNTGSTVNQQNNESKNTQRDYGGRTIKKKK